MNRKNSLLVLYLLFAITCTLLHAQCKEPRYKKGLILEESADAVTMNVSIQVDEFAPRRLVCLAEHFQKKYAGRKEIVITIFDSQDAAEHSRPIVESTPALHAWASHKHAYYYYDQSKKENYLKLLPDANNRGLEQAILLPVKGIPPCNLQIDNRCLLQFKHIEYPWKALKNNVSGTVRLKATIEHDGRMSDVSVVSADIDPVSSKELLVVAAETNLETWRFEKNRVSRTIQIDYSYKIDQGTYSYENEHASPVQFHLPNQVVISAHPVN